MKQLRIVLADGNQRLRISVRTKLEHLDYLVVGEATNGHDALIMTRQLRPDIVLIEKDIPTLSGIEVARLLHDERVAPVVLLASSSNRDIAVQARQAGVVGFLLKPIKEGELMPTIEVACVRWLEHQRRRRQLSELQDRIDARKVIELAKGYLMDQHGLQETEAFRKIQRIAMNSRKTMREVAQAILLTQQLSG